MDTGLENKTDDGSADGVVLLLPRSYTLIVAGGAVLGIVGLASAAGVVVGGASLTS